MLTVDYGRLGLQPGQRVLDLGCGFGRHAFEVLRRGGRVIAADLALPELAKTRDTFGAMYEAGEVGAGGDGAVCVGDATRLPFADGSFHHVIASEVLEHVPDDRAALTELARILRPAGTLAATVPAFLPERVCWALSDDYHAPTVVGGHVRIYTRAELEVAMTIAGLTPVDHHRAHALHSPYWWLRCAVGPTNEDHPAVKAYKRFLTWDIVEQPRSTRLAERLLNPVLGKSMVVYARKSTGTATDAKTEDNRAAA